MDRRSKLILSLRLIILALLIIFLISFEYTPKNNCEACKFNIEDKQVSIDKFMRLYYEKCVYPFKDHNQLSEINFSRDLSE